jgi:predicted metal-dependent hydrolase
MPKTVVIESDLTCTLKKIRRAKHIRIIVHQDGVVVVTAPRYASYRTMEKHVKENIIWIKKQLHKQEHHPVRISPHGSNHDYLHNKEKARAFVKKRLLHYNQFYGFSFNRVSIRNQRTRWGSCSAKQNLNFSYKILFLPSELADYIIVHELCHLKELNHSKQFWQLVGQKIPNYVALRKQLKQQVV